MLAGQLMDLRSMLHKQGVIFAYSGYVTEPVLSGVGEALKQKLTIDDADTKTLRSVFAIFVKQMQNIIRYSAEMQLAPPPPASDAGALKEIRYGIPPSAGKAWITSCVPAISYAKPTSSAFASG
jgi:hypothetical protein